MSMRECKNTLVAVWRFLLADKLVVWCVTLTVDSLSLYLCRHVCVCVYIYMRARARTHTHRQDGA